MLAHKQPFFKNLNHELLFVSWFIRSTLESLQNSLCHSLIHSFLDKRFIHQIPSQAIRFIDGKRSPVHDIHTFPRTPRIQWCSGERRRCNPMSIRGHVIVWARLALLLYLASNEDLIPILVERAGLGGRGLTGVSSVQRERGSNKQGRCKGNYTVGRTRQDNTKFCNHHF